MKTRSEMGRLENPDRPAYHIRKQIFSEENIHALTITMRVIPARIILMVAGRANHRNDRDVPRASLYPVPGTVQYSKNV